MRTASSMPLPTKAPTFDDVYTEEFAYLWRSLRRLGVRADELEDAAHDVFIVVHRRLADYDPGRPLRAWLFGISYRIVSERRRRGPPPTEELADVPDPCGGPHGALASAEARRLLAAALDQLDLDQRAVLLLHDLEEQSAPEIARALDVPLNTVYSRLRLARRKLARALGVDEGEQR